MDHDYIEQHQVVDRFLMGRLSDDELSAFEEHYLDCQTCLDELEAAEAFQAGLRHVAARPAAAPAAKPARPGLLDWLRGLAQPQILAPVAAALLIVVGAPLYWANGQVGSLRNQLAAALQPSTDVAVVALSPLRSGGVREPDLTIEHTKHNRVVRLDLDPASSEYARFEVRVVDGAGRVLWRGDVAPVDDPGLPPGFAGYLPVVVQSAFFAPGDYMLEVYGLSDGEAQRRTADYLLRVTAAR